MAIALSVVPVIVGLVVLALRLGLPPIFETPAAVVLGVTISPGYALAGQLPGGRSSPMRCSGAWPSG